MASFPVWFWNILHGDVPFNVRNLLAKFVFSCIEVSR